MYFFVLLFIGFQVFSFIPDKSRRCRRCGNIFNSFVNCSTNMKKNNRLDKVMLFKKNSILLYFTDRHFQCVQQPTVCHSKTCNVAHRVCLRLCMWITCLNQAVLPKGSHSFLIASRRVGVRPGAKYRRGKNAIVHALAQVWVAAA